MAITRVGVAAAAGTSVTIPNYLKGDLIVFWSFRNGSTTAPGTPSGFTSLSSGGANSCSDRLAYRIATADGSGVGSGSSSNATHSAVAVYRGTNGPGTVSTAGSGSSTSLNYPSVTPAIGDGSSWMVAFGSHRTATNVEQAPSGMSNQTSTGSGPETAVHDTNGGVSSWSSTSVTVNANSGWRSRVLEIKAEPSPKAARGMRRLISGYTGNLFRLVGGAGGGSLDIPVNTSTGEPDLATTGFSSWAGSNTIKIDKVYDQTGNGWDLVQTNDGERPLFIPSRTLGGAHRAIMPFGRNFDESASLSIARNNFTCFSVQRPWTAGYNLNCYWSFGSATFMLAGSAQSWSFNTGVWGSSEYHVSYDREQMNVFGCASGADGVQLFMNDNTSSLQTAQTSATLTAGWVGKSSSYDASMDWFASLIWSQSLTQFNGEAARDDLYARFPVDHTSARHLVVDGDSISNQSSHDLYGDGQFTTALASLGVPIQFDHLAVAGQSMATMDTNRANVTARAEGGMSRNVAYAHGGSNDIDSGSSAATIWGDASAGMLRYIRALVTAFGTNHVIIGTILDRQWSSSAAAKDAVRASLNQTIRDNAATEGYLVADYATDTALEDASNTSSFPDAIHPNKAGTDKMAAVLAPLLSKAFDLGVGSAAGAGGAAAGGMSTASAAGAASGQGAALAAAPLPGPAVVARATSVSSTTDATSFSPTLPGSPVAGHLLVAFVSADGNPTLSTGSTGWEKLVQASDATNVTGAVFFKFATGSDTLNITSTTSEQYSAVVYELSGTHMRLIGAAANGTSANSNPPNIDPALTRDYLFLTSRHGDSTAVATAAPAGFSSLQTATAGGANGVSTNTAERSVSGSSQDPGAFTSSSEEWVCSTLAIWEDIGGEILWNPANGLASVTGREFYDFGDPAKHTIVSDAYSAAINVYGVTAQDASQPTAGNRPAQVANAVNGLPAARTALGDGKSLVRSAYTSSAIQFVEADFSDWIGLYGRGGPGFTKPMNASGWRVHAFVFGTTGSSFYEDGSLAWTDVNTWADDGVVWWISNRTGSDGWGQVLNDTAIMDGWPGDVLEIGKATGTLTTADRDKLIGYGCWRAGLQANLPSAHPYRSGPPTMAGSSGVGASTAAASSGGVGAAIASAAATSSGSGVASANAAAGAASTAAGGGTAAASAHGGSIAASSASASGAASASAPALSAWSPHHLPVPPRVWVRGRNAAFDGADGLTALADAGTDGGSFTVNGAPSRGAALAGRATIRLDAVTESVSKTLTWASGKLFSFGLVKMLSASEGVLWATDNYETFTGSAAAKIAEDGELAATGNGYEAFFGGAGPLIDMAAGSAGVIADHTQWNLVGHQLGATCDVWGNGVAGTAWDRKVDGVMPTYSATTFHFLGLTSGDTGTLNGDCAELLFLDYFPTTTERQQIEGWAAWEYGLAALLPSGHPYAAGAPTYTPPSSAAGAAAGSAGAGAVGGAAAAGAGASAGSGSLGAVGRAFAAAAAAVAGLAAAAGAALAIGACAGGVSGLGSAAGVGASVAPGQGGAGGGASAAAAGLSAWGPQHLASAPRVWIDGDRAAFNGSDQLTAIPNAGSVGGGFTVNGAPTKATLNGRNGVHSASTANNLTQAFAWPSSGVMSAFVVFDLDTLGDSGTGSLLQSGDVAPTGSVFLVLDYDDPGSGNALVGDGYSPGPRAGVSPSPYDTAPHFMLMSAGTSANDQWVDGVQQTLVENVSGTFPAYSSRTWTFLYGWSSPLGGAAFQILLLDYVLSAGERQQLEGWAAWKYGLQANLPSGHPYKTSAPSADGGSAGAGSAGAAVTGVGASIAGGPGAAAGVAASAGVGAATGAASATADGQGQASAVSAAQVAAAGQAAGQGTAAAVAGSSTGSGAGAGAGQGQASAEASPLHAAAGSAAGSATAPAVGAAQAAAAAQAAGQGTAAAVAGSSTGSGAGAASGQGQATAQAAPLHAAAGSAAGSAAASASHAAAGSAGGQATAAGVSPPPLSIADARILAITAERRVLAVGARPRVLGAEAERRTLSARPEARVLIIPRGFS